MLKKYGFFYDYLILKKGHREKPGPKRAGGNIFSL